MEKSNIKWKNNQHPNFNGPPPEKIYLSSIEFNKIFKQQKSYSKFKKNFLSLFRFLKMILTLKMPLIR